MGIDLLTEEQYRALQKLGDFEAKTSCWVKTSLEASGAFAGSDGVACATSTHYALTNWSRLSGEIRIAALTAAGSTELTRLKY